MCEGIGTLCTVVFKCFVHQVVFYILSTKVCYWIGTSGWRVLQHCSLHDCVLCLCGFYIVSIAVLISQVVHDCFYSSSMCRSLSDIHARGGVMKSMHACSQCMQSCSRMQSDASRHAVGVNRPAAEQPNRF